MPPDRDSTLDQKKQAVLTRYLLRGELRCPNCGQERQPFGTDARLHEGNRVGLTVFCSTPDCGTKFEITLAAHACPKGT